MSEEKVWIPLDTKSSLIFWLNRCSMSYESGDMRTFLNDLEVLYNWLPENIRKELDEFMVKERERIRLKVYRENNLDSVPENVRRNPAWISRVEASLKAEIDMRSAISMWRKIHQLCYKYGILTVETRVVE